MAIKCQLFTAFAYLGLVASLASVYYLVKTRGMATPFTDSLSPAQKLLKGVSKAVRKDIFLTGAGFAIAFLAIFQPFHSCNVSE